MSDLSEVVQAMVDARVSIDVLEDKLSEELTEIRQLLEDSVDVQARAAYSRLSDLIRAFDG